MRLSEVVGWQGGGADRRRGLEEFEMCTTAKAKGKCVPGTKGSLLGRISLRSAGSSIHNKYQTLASPQEF